MYPGPPNKSGSQDIAVKLLKVEYPFIFKGLYHELEKLKMITKYHELEKHKMITNNKRNKKIIVEEKLVFF